jgi:hypothetical protein
MQLDKDIAERPRGTRDTCHERPLPGLRPVLTEATGDLISSQVSEESLDLRIVKAGRTSTDGIRPLATSLGLASRREKR